MQPQLQAWLDQEDARIKDTIRKHGWVITYVGGGECSRPGCDGGADEEPPFGYTTGLFGLGHPELVVVGLDTHTTAGLLDTLAGRIRDGEELVPGIELSFGDWQGHTVIPEDVPNPGDIVFESNRFYQRPDEFSVPVLQLTYTDNEGRYPWDVGYSYPEIQPRPGPGGPDCG
jgi:hypothetical protein